ncbi:leucine-rich repeats and immunoglobulin-like domains protein 1 isoform X1 [Varroa destructor]|uniref:Ig-like domain-containing protein n=1 Tax=Varroa destructor TaxID=109461 RepID=A0A7M7K8P9_VARDE|nr:leucine-rich repeats and immunoglobulin-like domains protein 1 isoform X1 [Varroa destructor]
MKTSLLLMLLSLAIITAHPHYQGRGFLHVRAGQNRHRKSSGSAHRDSDDPLESGDFWAPSSKILPSFDNSTASNVTSQLGVTAYLHCLVNNLGDKTVLWIRRKDAHVLTVGMDTFTADDRFQTMHVDNHDWALQIKYVQMSDAGRYECQVSSDPKISYFVNLTVLVAKARIEGGPEMFIRTGSAINLTCTISQSAEPPPFVFWYHNDKMINYMPQKGEITLHKTSTDTTVSRLYIRRALVLDSGNYTCGPANAEPVSISVHVVAGEKPAAMQHDASPGLSSVCPRSVGCSNWTIMVFLFISYAIVKRHR